MGNAFSKIISPLSLNIYNYSRDTLHVCGWMCDGLDACYVTKLSQHVQAVAVYVFIFQENCIVRAVTRHY